MNQNRLEAIREREAARDAALTRLAESVPYIGFLGAQFERMGDELTARLPFDQRLIGNPLLPAIHGGVTGSFLEITAITQLAWDQAWALIEANEAGAEAIARGEFPAMPKTIDISVDYLRSGRARDLFARAIVAKRGRRVANVRVEAWQDERDRPIATAHAHFLLAETTATGAP